MKEKLKLEYWSRGEDCSQIDQSLECRLQMGNTAVILQWNSVIPFWQRNQCHYIMEFFLRYKVQVKLWSVFVSILNIEEIWLSNGSKKEIPHPLDGLCPTCVRLRLAFFSSYSISIRWALSYLGETQAGFLLLILHIHFSAFVTSTAHFLA